MSKEKPTKRYTCPACKRKSTSMYNSIFKIITCSHCKAVIYPTKMKHDGIVTSNKFYRLKDTPPTKAVEIVAFVTEGKSIKCVKEFADRYYSAMIVLDNGQLVHIREDEDKDYVEWCLSIIQKDPAWFVKATYPARVEAFYEFLRSIGIDPREKYKPVQQ